MASQLFDIQHQLIFYGAYHHNKVNVGIHMICVPILVFTAQVMLARAPIPTALVDLRHLLASSLPGPLGDYAGKMGWDGLVSTSYLIYYLILEPVAGVLITPIVLALVSFANTLARTDGGLQAAIAVHILSWIAQFIGHGVFEKRAPALLDNLVGAVVLAPFFVFLELLFKFGYNKQLCEQVDRGVLKEIGRIRAKEQKNK